MVVQSKEPPGHEQFTVCPCATPRMQFSMFNVWTLYQTEKLDQQLRGAQTLPLDIIDIQEHQLLQRIAK